MIVKEDSLLKIFKKFHFNLIPIILISILMLKLIFTWESSLIPFGSKILSMLSPFFWALGLAYFFNPLMKLIERRFNIRRVPSLIITYIIVIGVIALGVVIIFPTVFNSLGDLFRNLPEYAENTEVWLTDKINEFNKDYYLNPLIVDRLEETLTKSLNEINVFISSLLSSLFSSTIKFTTSFLKFIFGFIISIYILKDKEKLLNISKKIICRLFPEPKQDEILEFLGEANSVFSEFIIGKSIDSFIIGVLCYIGLILIHAPFALLISIIVGVTNMIPYFGPFIGMIPAFILTFLTDPMKAFIVLLFIFLLQQFDGFYLGPKILSEKVGLSPLLVILAITIGGGLFGVLGMFLSVPIMALIKTYSLHIINNTSHKEKEQ